jgi:hypothetical protein
MSYQVCQLISASLRRQQQAPQIVLLYYVFEDEFIKRRELVDLVTAYHVIPGTTADK